MRLHHRFFLILHVNLIIFKIELKKTNSFQDIILSSKFIVNVALPPKKFRDEVLYLTFT